MMTNQISQVDRVLSYKVQNHHFVCYGVLPIVIVTELYRQFVQ